MRHVLYLVAPNGVRHAASRHIIQHVAVRARNNCGIIGRFRTPLNLQAVHTCIHQIVQMVDHAHIAGVHNIRALFVLKYREIFAGSLFLHQRILIAARLRARAAV